VDDTGHDVSAAIPTPLPIPIASIEENVAESSTSAKKRALSLEAEDATLPFPNTSLASINGQVKKQKQDQNGDGVTAGKRKSKGKGKGKDIEGEGNRFKGHRWDCTGLVTRYTKPTEMPSELVKCMSFSSDPRNGTHNGSRGPNDQIGISDNSYFPTMIDCPYYWTILAGSPSLPNL
jgi:hypothetical protein